MFDFEYARRLMIERQLSARGVKEDRVLEAMGRVPREKFVKAGMAEFAYEDSPLPIGEGQTISQPYVVAHMIESARLKPEDRVLEVGAGSGYAAAVMGQVARDVFTIERHRALAERARERLRELGYGNVRVLIGDGSMGWQSEAPFNAIIVTASGPAIPAALREQLDVGGRLVMPVEGGAFQRLMRVTRTGESRFDEEDLGGVMFVPLVGEQGWADATARTQGAVARTGGPARAATARPNSSAQEQQPRDGSGHGQERP